MRRMVMDHTLEEHVLVDAWRAGDTGAMGMLYERYAPALRAYCTHRLGNDVDAEDAVHDTFLKAQLGVNGFQAQARLWPWLASIAAHVCADMHRRRLRSLDVEALAPVARDIDEQMAARVRIAIVGEALSSLPPRYRAPLYLKHFMGSTYEEIARLQGRSVASVRSILMRGRRNLGQRIETVARSERQWPLPITLPLGRRLRLKNARSGSGILARSMQQLAFLEAGWLATAAMMAPTAAAVAISTAVPMPAIAADDAMPKRVQAPAALWLPESSVPSLPRAGLVGVSTRQTHARMSTNDADVPGDPPVEGGASVERTEYSIWINFAITAELPVYGTYTTSGTQTVRCREDLPVRPCDYVDPLLEELPL